MSREDGEAPPRRRAWTPWGRLRERGILGMNERNAAYIMACNPRRLYPLVDDKLRTKTLAEGAGIAVPTLYGTVTTESQNKRLAALLGEREEFVIKPAHGSGGNGILVIVGREGPHFLKANGERLDLAGLQHHVSNGLSGMFSLGGHPDAVMVEARVRFDEVFAPVSFQGVPDIRTIVFRGLPVAAMVRLPTRASDGKANLHQGAVGVGIDMRSGRTGRGVCHSRPIQAHPDTLQPLGGLAIPGWEALVELAARCHELAGLGYLGVDVVLDRDAGPLVLELNARPGLAIQLANDCGLRPLLQAVASLAAVPGSIDERLVLARRVWATAGTAPAGGRPDGA